VKKERVSTRRRKTSPAARLRSFWVLIAVVAVALIGVAAFAVAWPGFEPKEIDVSGNRVVSSGEILSSAAVAPHVNMWLQSPTAIARRVEKIPYVAVAHVRRVPPTTMTISITERKPFAVVRDGARTALVDRELRVLQAGASGDAAQPEFVLARAGALEPGAFLTEPSAIELRDDYDALIAAQVVPLALSFDRYGGLVADLRGGVRILLGDDADLNKKLPLIDPILAQVVRKARRVAEIDLRAPGTPVVVYK
jgi:cell division protein FtsQ